MNNDELVKKYFKAKELYYTTGESGMTDEEFDSLEDYLIDKGLIYHVGHKEIPNKLKHSRPMLSLTKTREIDDIKSFLNKPLSIQITENGKNHIFNKHFLLATEKLDGSAIAIRYENGNPTIMLTRGDGKYGRNISEKIKYLDLPKNITIDPLILPGIDINNCKNFEVRGEIIITFSNYEKIKSEFNSIRNCVAGILNRKENYEDSMQYLTFMAYDVILNEKEEENTNNIEYIRKVISTFKFTTEYDKLNWLMYNGFNIPKYYMVSHEDEIDFAINNLIKSNVYLTDGIVFTNNNLLLHNEYSDHSPKFKLAYKVINEIATTKINNLVYKANSSGKISIVAEIEPVVVSGATLSNVTCYNAKTVLEQGLFPGTVIEIIRSGEIIPKIHKVLSTNSGDLITNCPTCNSELTMKGVDLVCENENCYSKISLRILKFVNLFGDKTKGISLSTIEKLLDNNLIETAADLNQLKYEDLIKIDGFSKITANNLINTFRDLDITLKEIIIYCNIHLLGSKTVDKILNSINGDFITNLEDCIMEIGVMAYTKLIENKLRIALTIDEFKHNGWNIVETKKAKNNKFNFIITGKLTKPRKEIEKDIENFGYNISNTVNKDVILVCNEQDSNSSKMKKAKQLNIEIITEDELYKNYLIN